MVACSAPIWTAPTLWRTGGWGTDQSVAQFDRLVAIALHISIRTLSCSSTAQAGPTTERRHSAQGECWILGPERELSLGGYGPS